MRYFPVETSIERAKMTAYHAKATDMHDPSLASEVVRFGLDKEIALDG